MPNASSFSPISSVTSREAVLPVVPEEVVGPEVVHHVEVHVAVAVVVPPRGLVGVAPDLDLPRHGRQLEAALAGIAEEHVGRTYAVLQPVRFGLDPAAELGRVLRREEPLEGPGVAEHRGAPIGREIDVEQAVLVVVGGGHRADEAGERPADKVGRTVDKTPALVDEVHANGSSVRPRTRSGSPSLSKSAKIALELKPSMSSP